MNAYCLNLLKKLRLFTTLTIGAVALAVPTPTHADLGGGVSCDTASSLAFGIEYQGRHDFSGDLDYFAFDVPARGVIRIRARSVGFEETRIQVLGTQCLGLMPTGFRNLGGTDDDRLLYFEHAGRQIVRVRGGEDADPTSFSLRVDFVPTPEAATAQLDVRWATGGTCGLVGGLDQTTTPEPDEQDLDGQNLVWPAPEPNGAAAVPASFLRVAGDLGDVADEDVLSVRVTRAGLLDVDATGTAIAASLYQGDHCSAATQVATDIALNEAPLLQWVDPGLYHLRLAPQSEVGGPYELALRMLPIPGSR